MIGFFRKKRGVPTIRQRSEHCISRRDIDADALRVLYRLSKAGYTAYMVGGSVRDLLLGLQPKDFDISTNARPAQIRRLFRNCFLIGKRFRLAHIVFGRKVIETSTFRRQPESSGENGDDIYQSEDNTFGTPQEDALRRDFTVNGLFYDIKTFNVIDYVEGLRDIEARVIRSIGNPGIRFREDPVRMLRAIKFSARLDFEISRETLKAIRRHHAEIRKASIPRVCEEIFRLLACKAAAKAFPMLWQYGLMRDLLPAIDDYVVSARDKGAMLWRCLDKLDNFVPANHPAITNGVRLAVLHYPLFKTLLEQERRDSGGKRVNRQLVARKALSRISADLHIPKAALTSATMLLEIQQRFEGSPQSGRGQRFAGHPIFEEALAFQRILVEAGEADGATLSDWQELRDRQIAYQEKHHPDSETEPGEPRDDAPAIPARRKRRGRRRRKKTVNAN